MPYTAAHPIAVAPIWYLSGRRIPLSALVVGSLSPDFPYYVFLTPAYAPGHTVMGLITNCLPQGLVVFLVWRYWIRGPLFRLGGIASHSPTQWSLPYAILTVTGIVLGAATHNLWDSMSHYNGWMVERVPLLQSVAIGLPAFKIIQYGSGVLGLFAIAYWVKREFAGLERRPEASTNRTFGIAIFLSSISLLEVVTIWLHGTANIYTVIVNASVALLSGLFVGSVLFSAIDRIMPSRPE